MTKMPKKPRAIDLYSGAGGWSLGLRLAGIEILASYDWWGPANETNFKNNKHPAQTIDVRRLELADLPNNIDIVVGSPPCTQFSFANRGGNGDIADGLKDIVKFLSIIDHLRPKFWAMENVPRVAGILERELKAGGKLSRFKNLGVKTAIVNMARFGVPQRRMRCIAGNFDFELLNSYAMRTQSRTLGDIVSALTAGELITDPIFGVSLPASRLVDHIAEDVLTEEEVRINRAAKSLHPVYNAMAFPDPLVRTVRTITATCTRVSRESVVIECPSQPGAYRRLTLREKACLQGFPIDYQFYAPSYDQKAQLVGNAIPPPFAYCVAQAMRNTPVDALPSIPASSFHWNAPTALEGSSTPPRRAFRYPPTRTFRFAIPSLRLKSGVRFELANSTQDERTSWAVGFIFGDSKSIHRLEMSESVFRNISGDLPSTVRAEVLGILDRVHQYVLGADIANMQKIWSHRGVGRTRPFMLLDMLSERGEDLASLLKPYDLFAQQCVSKAVLAQHGTDAENLSGLGKLAKNATQIWAGLLLGSRTNAALAAHPLDASRPSPILTIKLPGGRAP